MDAVYTGFGDSEKVHPVLILEQVKSAHDGEFVVEILGLSTSDYLKTVGFGVETEDTAADGGHGGVGGAQGVLVVAGADEYRVVAALCQAADRQGDIFSVFTEGHPKPNVVVLAKRDIHAAIGIEFVEDILVVRQDEKAARGRARVDGRGVGTVRQERGHMSADVDRANLNKIVGILGMHSAPHQSQNACKQAEKYFVTFHKILLIS